MVYTANWVIIYHLPPFKGTRNSCWNSFWRRSFFSHFPWRVVWLVKWCQLFKGIDNLCDFPTEVYRMCRVRDETPPSTYGEFFINHEIKIIIKQPGFYGKDVRLFVSPFVAHIASLFSCIFRDPEEESMEVQRVLIWHSRINWIWLLKF